MEDQRQHQHSISAMKLNETQLSTTICDNSMQDRSIVVLGHPDNRQVMLHSYYLYRREQRRGQEGTSERAVPSPSTNRPHGYRLLNCEPHPESKRLVVKQEVDEGNRKAFGSSEPRLQSRLQVSRAEQTQTGMNDLKEVVVSTFICAPTQKGEAFIDRRNQVTAQPDQKNVKSRSPFKLEKLGFGTGSAAERESYCPSLYKSNSPGPGAYQTQSNVQDKQNSPARKLRREKLIKKQRKVMRQLKQKHVELEPGPGAYNLPTLVTQKQAELDRLKVRQVYAEHKRKARRYLESIKSHSKQPLSQLSKAKERQSPNKQSGASMKPAKTEARYKEQRDRPKSDGKKLYRAHLKQITDQFLPKQEQIEFKNQVRGPIYKHMLSNSFVPKNDHAFEAHLSRAPEPASQYIFIKGRDPKPKVYQQGYNFKSETVRCVFP